MDSVSTPPSPAEQVHAAALYLDEHGPEDWRDRVNLAELRMGSIFYCVLGQVYADGDWASGYSSGLHQLFDGQTVGLGSPDALAAYGFTVDVFAAWDAEWKAELTGEASQ